MFPRRPFRSRRACSRWSRQCRSRVSPQAPEHAGGVYARLGDQPYVALPSPSTAPIDWTILLWVWMMPDRPLREACTRSGGSLYLHFFFRFLAVRAKLGEAGRLHHDRLYPLRAAFLYGLRRSPLVGTRTMPASMSPVTSATLLWVSLPAPLRPWGSSGRASLQSRGRPDCGIRSTPAYPRCSMHRGPLCFGIEERAEVPVPELRRGDGGGIDEHAGIDDDVAVGIEEDRVEVYFADLRIGDDQLRHLYEGAVSGTPGRPNIHAPHGAAHTL